MTNSVISIQDGDFTVDLQYITGITFDVREDYKCADVTFSQNPHDEDFEPEDQYTFEEADYKILIGYLVKTNQFAKYVMPFMLG